MPRRSSSGSPLSADATTARVPESSTTYRTSSGVSMTLIGMTTAPVLAMRVVGDEPLPAVRAVERDAVARPDARRDEAVRGAVRQRLQVIEGERAVADQQRRPSPEPPRGDRQDLTDRARHPGRPFVSSRTVRSAGGTGARAGGEPTRPGACRLDRRARPEDRERGDMLASRWTQVVPPDRPSWRGPSRTGAPACFACTPPVMAGSLACACPAAGSRSAACARCARRPGSVTGSSR